QGLVAGEALATDSQLRGEELEHTPRYKSYQKDHHHREDSTIFSQRRDFLDDQIFDQKEHDRVGEPLKQQHPTVDGSTLTLREVHVRPQDVPCAVAKACNHGKNRAPTAVPERASKKPGINFLLRFSAE